MPVWFLGFYLYAWGYLATKTVGQSSVHRKEPEDPLYLAESYRESARRLWEQSSRHRSSNFHPTTRVVAPSKVDVVFFDDSDHLPVLGAANWREMRVFGKRKHKTTQESTTFSSQLDFSSMTAGNSNAALTMDFNATSPVNSTLQLTTQSNSNLTLNLRPQPSSNATDLKHDLQLASNFGTASTNGRNVLSATKFAVWTLIISLYCITKSNEFF